MSGPGLRLGELQLTVCADVTFRLDGGAMFSIVPRTVWQRYATPDDRNRVAVPTNCLVVRGVDFHAQPAVVLVDTGLGEFAADPRYRDRYGVTEHRGNCWQPCRRAVWRRTT